MNAAAQIADVAAAHPRLRDLPDFYERRLRPFLAAQEDARKAALARFVKVAAVAAPVAALAIFLPWRLDLYPTDNIGVVVSGLAIAATAVFLFFQYGHVADIAGATKHEVVARICAFLGFDYRPEPRNADLSRHRALGLVPAYELQRLEDEIYGSHAGVSFTLCEAHLQTKERRRTAKGGTTTSYKTVFRGVLAEFDFPKPFSGRTVVRSDGGLVDRGLAAFDAGERVRLEDPRFEKRFDVRSTDQVEARYLLTPTFMERATALADAVDGRLQFAFEGDRLYLTVNGGGDRFEVGSGLGSFDDPGRVARIASEIAIVFRIIDALRLDAASRV